MRRHVHGKLMSRSGRSWKSWSRAASVMSGESGRAMYSRLGNLRTCARLASVKLVLAQRQPAKEFQAGKLLQCGVADVRAGQPEDFQRGDVAQVLRAGVVDRRAVEVERLEAPAAGKVRQARAGELIVRQVQLGELRQSARCTRPASEICVPLSVRFFSRGKFGNRLQPSISELGLVPIQVDAQTRQPPQRAEMQNALIRDLSRRDQRKSSQLRQSRQMFQALIGEVALLGRKRLQGAKRSDLL